MPRQNKVKLPLPKNPPNEQVYTAEFQPEVRVRVAFRYKIKSDVAENIVKHRIMK